MTAEEPRYIEVAILTHPDAADGLFDVLQSLEAWPRSAVTST